MTSDASPHSAAPMLDPDPGLPGSAEAGAPTIRPMREDDAPWTADQHVRHLPHGLFPRLGRRFMRRWHVDQVRSPFGITLLAERDGQRVGFLLGSSDQVRHVGWIIAADRPRLALLGLMGLLRSPRTFVAFVRRRSVRYARRLLGVARRTRPAGPLAPVGPVAVVQAVVVDPTARGGGAGRLLIEEFLAAARAAGTSRADLVTQEGASGATGFYETLGWQPVETHADLDGTLVRTYRTSTGGTP